MEKEQKIKAFTSSIILNILAIFSSFAIFQGLVFVLAKFFNIPVGLDSFVVTFKVTDASYLWTSTSIIAIFGLPPFISLALSIITRRLYESFARRKRTNLKLFLTWASLHFDNLFWGSIIAGLLTRSGFSYFLSWIYIPYFVQIMIAIGAAVLFFFKHPYLNYSFLQASPASTFIDKENHKKYKFIIIWLPLLAATILLSAIAFPNFSIHEAILKVTPVIALIGTRKYIDCEDVKLVRSSMIFTPNYIFMIPILVFVLSFYFLL